MIASHGSVFWILKWTFWFLRSRALRYLLSKHLVLRNPAYHELLVVTGRLLKELSPSMLLTCLIYYPTHFLVVTDGQVPDVSVLLFFSKRLISFDLKAKGSQSLDQERVGRCKVLFLLIVSVSSDCCRSLRAVVCKTVLHKAVDVVFELLWAVDESALSRHVCVSSLSCTVD